MLYRNILLIDDDEDDHEIFLAALEIVSPSSVCTTLSNAGEALQKLNAKHIVADLIFLDLNMPPINGKELLKKIKNTEETKNIPVIILSTSSHPATIRETKDLGAFTFITKPNKFDDLVIILKSLIN